MNITDESREARSVLMALRRIIQAVDIHSRSLMQSSGLSVPQLLVLQALEGSAEALGTSALAQRLTLTQGTISAILERLERKQLITRERGGEDKRRVQVQLTEQGREVLDATPEPLQDSFLQAFGALPDYERSQLLASLQRLAALMQPAAEQLQEAQLDAAPSPK